MSDWTKNKERRSNQKDADFEVSYPLAKQHQSTLTLDEEESSHYINQSSLDSSFRHYLRSFISTLFIFLGVYLTYGTSLIMARILILGSPGFSLYLLGFFFTGLVLTITGVEKFGDNANFKTYFVTPLLSFFLGFLFLIFPAPVQGQLFGWLSVVIFPLVLFFFYYVKEKVYPAENDLK